MAFNDFTPEQPCPRCGRDTLVPDEGLHSLADGRTPICSICHDEEPLYLDPWPGYPQIVHEDDLTSVTPDDVQQRHWRRAGVHGVLNRPGPDGDRESYVGVLEAGHQTTASHLVTAEAFAQQEGRVVTITATNKAFAELEAALKEVQR